MVLFIFLIDQNANSALKKFERIIMPDYLVIDIATEANDEAETYFSEGYCDHKVDRRLKDQKKIELHKKSLLANSANKWWLGKIKYMNCEFFNSEKNKEFAMADEKELLDAFCYWLENSGEVVSEITMVGKESKNFIQPYLIGRLMRWNLGLPWFMINRQIPDIDEIFSPYGRNDQVTNIIDYAWGLQIEADLEYLKSADRNENKSAKIRREISTEIMSRYQPYVQGGRGNV